MIWIVPRASFCLCPGMLGLYTGRRPLLQWLLSVCREDLPPKSTVKYGGKRLAEDGADIIALRSLLCGMRQPQRREREDGRASFKPRPLPSPGPMAGLRLSMPSSPGS